MLCLACGQEMGALDAPPGLMPRGDGSSLECLACSDAKQRVAAGPAQISGLQNLPPKHRGPLFHLPKVHTLAL